MTTIYHTAIATGESNAPATINTRLGALDAQLVTHTAQIAALNTSGVGSVYAQINNGSGEADTSWAIDNISGTFLAGAVVVYTVSDVVYMSTVAANTSTSPLTVTAAPGVTIPDNTVISQVPAAAAGKMLDGVFNVKDPIFGATGDGSTNDATAIQAAIDAASAGGGDVLFPPGEYFISTGLTLASNVNLVGSGDDSIIKTTYVGGSGVYDSGDINLVSGTSVTNVKIRNLRFEGAGLQYDTVGGDNSFGCGVMLVSCSNLLIEGCHFRHVQHGVRGQSLMYSRIANNHFSGRIANTCVQVYGWTTGPCQYNTIVGNTSEIDRANSSSSMGIRCDGSADENSKFNTVTGNALNGVALEAYSCERGSYNTFSANTADGALYGLVVYAGEYNRFDNNIVSNCATVGILVETRGTSYSANHNSFSGNTLVNVATGTTKDAISIITGSGGLAPTHTTIDGNRVIGAPTRYGIYATAVQTQITNNVVVNIGDNGIHVTANECTISNNRIIEAALTSTSSHGIFGASASYLTVTGNRVFRTASGTGSGIFLNGGSYNTVTGNIVTGFNQSTGYNVYVTSTNSHVNANWSDNSVVHTAAGGSSAGNDNDIVSLSNRFRVRLGTRTTGVSTSATTIWNNGSLGFASIVLVHGDNGSGKRFNDLVMVLSYGAVAVVQSVSGGGADARTYSLTSDTNLSLAMAAGTYTVRAGVLGQLDITA